MAAITKKRQTYSQAKFLRQLKAIFTWLIRFNRHLFAPLATLTLGTFLIEAVTYSGFVKKMTDVSPSFFLAMAILSYCVLLFRKFFFKDDFTPEAKLLLRANALTLPFGLFILTSLWRLEAENFPNYVFSTFHVNLELLQGVLNISFFLAFPYILTYYLDIKTVKMPKAIRHIDPYLVKSFFLAISLVILVALQLNSTFLRLGKDMAAIISTPFASFEDRRRQVIGEHLEIFAFLNQYIDEKATVAVAPQRMSGTVGNVGYARYFMYPRYLMHEEDFPVGEVPEIDYFVISPGVIDEETGAPIAWPNKSIPAEAIYIYDEKTREVTTLPPQMYEPNNPIFLGKWGVLKIAKPHK